MIKFKILINENIEYYETNADIQYLIEMYNYLDYDNFLKEIRIDGFYIEKINHSLTLKF